MYLYIYIYIPGFYGPPRSNKCLPSQTLLPGMSGLTWWATAKEGANIERLIHPVPLTAGNHVSSEVHHQFFWWLEKDVLKTEIFMKLKRFYASVEKLCGLCRDLFTYLFCFLCVIWIFSSGIVWWSQMGIITSIVFYKYVDLKKHGWRPFVPLDNGAKMMDILFDQLINSIPKTSQILL